MMSQRLRSNFEMFNKACYVCGSFDHLEYDCDYHQRQFKNKEMVKPVWNYTQRVNHQIFSRLTHPSPKRNMVPKAVLMKSGLVSLTTARPDVIQPTRTTVNNARPMTNVFNKAHSTVRRPINNKTITKNSNFNQKVNIVRPKAVLNTVKEIMSMLLRPQLVRQIQDKEVINSGCSRNMTGNMSYLTYSEEIDGGYVAFGGNPKGRKITGRGTIKTEGGDPRKDSEGIDQEKEDNVNNTNTVNAASTNEFNTVGGKTSIDLLDDPNMPTLEDIIYSLMMRIWAIPKSQPKVPHLRAIKKNFRYLKGQPKLGLWYPKDSPFDLVTYTDSDYAGASLDKKSTTKVITSLV
ncbi:hypothetical protein Tco_0180968 [Tanacetum coccineum]